MKRRDFAKMGLATAAGTMVPLTSFLARRAFGQSPQGTPLPGSAIPQFVDALPPLQLLDGTAGPITLTMEEFRSPVMPSSFVPAAGAYGGTWVWGYRNNSTGYPYIGPVILAKRGVPTELKVVNNLGAGSTTMVSAWASSTDQTLHWANPLDAPMMMNMEHYLGPVPAVPHLHGGEIPALLDGGPDAWFTSDGAYAGMGYYSKDGPGPKNYCIYRYPNTQEAASIWFHDHGLGITRLNVYAGLAGGYLLRDDAATLPAGLTAYGIGSEIIVPLVIQDRLFDTNGQLYFPNLGVNPDVHPYWRPEFLGDTIVVNGKVWPTFGTRAAPKPSKRYRFLLLNGSNTRTYELYFQDPVTSVMGPPIWVIATDGGYLDRPVKIDSALSQKLSMMPGERYDVIVDFNDAAWRAANPGFSGQLVLRNSATVGMGGGGGGMGGGGGGRGGGMGGASTTTGQVLKLFIGSRAADSGYDPASVIALRQPMVRLVNPARGTAAVKTQRRRQLTLNHVPGPSGPLAMLVNNTRWSGLSVATDRFPGGVRPDFEMVMTGQMEMGHMGHLYCSELPNEGETELWEIINLTMMAHPIHLHLVQFQLMNRQRFMHGGYAMAYAALFPGTAAVNDPMTGMPYPAGVVIPGYGPPLDYRTGNAVALGGNPDVSKYLGGSPRPPAAHEAGWKDVVMAMPMDVTRFLVRWAPTSLPANTAVAHAYYPFDPSMGQGYVWHCHIIDHEDNEMMRPLSLVANPAAVRAYVQGTDY